MENEKASKRDIWDKADVFIKAFGIIFISGAITFYGIYSENQHKDTQLAVSAINNREQMYAQAKNDRQTAKVEVLKELLNIAMKDYHTENDMNRKLVKLKLLALNFQELDRELSAAPRKREELLRIATQLKLGQIQRLVTDGASSYRFHLRLNEKAYIRSKNNRVLFELVLLALLDDGIRVEVISPGENAVFSFGVGYYDLPFLDNFPLGDRRYAVVLDSLHPEDSSTFGRIVSYPRDYFDIQDRIRVDRLLGLGRWDMNKTKIIEELW